MTAVERWIAFRLDSQYSRTFKTMDEATTWLKTKGRTPGWFLSPVYAEGVPVA